MNPVTQTDLFCQITADLGMLRSAELQAIRREISDASATALANTLVAQQRIERSIAEMILSLVHQAQENTDLETLDEANSLEALRADPLQNSPNAGPSVQSPPQKSEAPDEPLLDSLATFTEQDSSPNAPLLASLHTQIDEELSGDNAFAGNATSQTTAASGPPRATKLRFRVVKPHAEGGLGKVSVAYDEELSRSVAMKEIRERFADILESRRRFVFEAEVTGQLEHPGVVPVYALGTHADGRPYYAMRFISGTSLEQAIGELFAEKDSETFKRKTRDLLTRFVNVCQTIEYAHSRGIIHRDLKPANIMLGEYGETLVVDWGLAKRIDSVPANKDATVRLQDLSPHRTSEPTKLEPGGDSQQFTSDSAIPASGPVVGTLQYMAPEQASGDSPRVRYASDIYSLGATLYHLLTGIPPREELRGRGITECLASIRNGALRKPREVRSAIPKSLQAIVLAAMQTDASRRYPSARALATDIENYLADDRVSVLPENLWQRAARWTRKHRGIAASVGAALIVIAGVALLAFIVTQQALKRTERLLAIAQLEQQFDRDVIAAENRGSGGALSPEQIPLAATTVDLLAGYVQKIEQLRQQGRDFDEASDRPRRLRLLGTWSNSLERLSRQRMDAATESLLLHEIDRLSETFPWKIPEVGASVARLRNLAADRVQQWYPLPAPLFPESDFQARGSSFVRNSVPREKWKVLLGDCLPGNMEVEADFDEAWSNSSLLGVVLNEHNGTSYQFVLADESFQPLYPQRNTLPLSQANELGRLCMFILRGDDVLRRQPIRIESNRRMIARRERGTRLTMAVGGKQMVFEDLFPLSPQHSGKFGLICPPGIGVNSFQTMHQRVPPTERKSGLPHIESGDNAFARGDNPAARRAYEKEPDDVEALFKLALTYEIELPARYEELLKDIVHNHVVTGSDDTRQRQWYLYAGVRLLLIALKDAHQLDISDIMDRLRTSFNMEDIQSLIPESEKSLFSDVLLKSGHRVRLALRNQGDVENLRDSIDLFTNNPESRRLARWRLADAIRFDRRLAPEVSNQQGRVILEKLLVELESLAEVDEMERATLLRDLVAVMLEQKDLAGALGLVNRYLKEDVSRIPTQHLPLLIERARIQQHLEDSAGAKADLEMFLREVNPQIPPPGIHYTHFSEACALLGLLLEFEGDVARAKKIWSQGRRRNWVDGFPDPRKMAMAHGIEMILEPENAEGLLAVKTDGFQEMEWRNIIECTIAGSGMDDRAVRNILLNSERIPREWLKLVSEKTYTGPRGEKLAHDYFFRKVPFREWPYEVISMILYQAVLHLAYEGEVSLKKHPDLDQVLYGQCRSLVEHYDVGHLEQKDFQFILSAMSGDWNEKTFQRLEKSLNDRPMSSGLALVFGCIMIRQHGKHELGEGILKKYVLEHREELPYVYTRMAEEVIKQRNVERIAS